MTSPAEQHRGQRKAMRLASDTTPMLYDRNKRNGRHEKKRIGVPQKRSGVPQKRSGGPQKRPDSNNDRRRRRLSVVNRSAGIDLR